jgi:glycosyltransferase A (GT-A) superfamily protein (DUF2064 family)
MRRNAVILFAGDARREEAEKGLPPRFLARLHARHARAIASLGDTDLIVAHDAAHAFRDGGPQLLGRRIREAVEQAFAAGYERVAILAGDVPALDRNVLACALGSRARAAVGRSPDGGFYLAAFRSLPQVDWESLPWCTAEAADALLAQLPDVELLAELEDLDDVHGVRDERLRRLLLSLLRPFAEPLSSPVIEVPAGKYEPSRAPPAAVA